MLKETVRTPSYVIEHDQYQDQISINIVLYKNL